MSALISVGGVTLTGFVTIGGTLAGGGSGDISGPGASTDNALARWDGTAGDALQDSLVTLGDTGNMTFAAGSQTLQGIRADRLHTTPGTTIVVDAANGSDVTGARASRPFATIAAALVVALSGDVVWIMAGTYTLATGITIPSGVSLVGISSNAVTLQLTGATANTDLVTMGESSRMEDLSLRLTSTGHFTLRGIVFPTTTSNTAKLRRLIVTVDNSTASDAGTSNVSAIEITGTGNVIETVHAIRASVINVLSAGLGNKRALLLSGAADLHARDTTFQVTRTGTGAGSYIAAAVTNASSQSTLRFCTLMSDPVATVDYLQTAGSLEVGASKLVEQGVWNFVQPVQSQGAFAAGVTAGAFLSASTFVSFVVGSQVNADYGPGNGGLYAGARAGTAGSPPTLAPFTGLSIFDNGIASGVDLDGGRVLYYGGGGWGAPDPHNHQFYTAPTYTETTDTGVIRFHIGSANQIASGGSIVIANGHFQIQGSVNSINLHQVNASGHNRLQSATNIGTNAAPGAGVILHQQGAGMTRIQRSAATSGTNQALEVITPAHTGQTAATELRYVDFNFSATVQWATGALATQRAMTVRRPTYAFVAASTITNAATLAVENSPLAGTNATLTNSYALWVQAGTSRFDGGVDSSAALRWTNTISPAALGAGNTNDYAPAGFADCSQIRQDASAAATLTGLAGGTDGRIVILTDISTTGANTITLTHDDANSAAANRFFLRTGASIVILDRGSVMLRYDGTSSRWRVFGVSL